MSHCKENLAESLQWWPLACGHGAHFPGSAVYCEVDRLSSSANQSEKVMQKIDLSGSGIIYLCRWCRLHRLITFLDVASKSEG